MASDGTRTTPGPSDGPPASRFSQGSPPPAGVVVWFRGLTPGQRQWAAGTIAAAVLLAVVGLVVDTWTPGRPARPPALAITQTISEVASRLDVTGKGLARELGLPLDVPKSTPLQNLGVSQEVLDHAVAHVLSHTSGLMKYFLYTALVLVGLVFAARVGRPDGSSPAARALWYPRVVLMGAMVTSAGACGFALGKSPNPMEGVVKVFKAMVGLYPDPLAKALALVFFLALAVIGNKLVCGWACPLGALQELAFSLPLVKSLKGRKVPFAFSNGFRGLLFIAAMLLMFGVIGGRKGFVLYHGLNPFNLFDREFESWFILGSVAATLLLSFVFYRPFCQFICPFGFASWLAERFSLWRVRIDPAVCTNCGACVRACPTQAAAGTLAGDPWRADCFSCTRCLSVCPADALRYELPGLSHPPSGTQIDRPPPASEVGAENRHQAGPKPA